MKNYLTAVFAYNLFSQKWVSVICKCFILSLIFFTCQANAKKFNSQEFTLKNGMQVIVIPNTKVPAVSHMVWYKIGSQDEPPGKSGIAHLLEHLMFKGTEKFTKGQFSKLVSKAGGNDNAFTSTDFTAYFQNISKDKLQLVMKLESDRMQGLTFTKEDIIKEKNVVLEERSSRIDNEPLSLLREQMKATLYLNHPYGRPLIGWRNEIEQLTLEDAKTWHNNYYAPNNAVLIVSGDITANELKPLAQKYYGHIKPRKTPKRRYLTEPNHISPRFITLSDKQITKPEWMRYYLAPSQNTPLKEHCFALILLSHIMGNNDTSRLYQKLVVDEKIAANVGSYYDDLLLGPSIFVIYAIPSGENEPDKIENSINEQIQQIKTKGVTQEELKRAKHSLIAETIYAQEDLKTLAYLYGQAITAKVGTSYIQNWEKKINSVTGEQIKQAANIVFKQKNSVTGRLLKEAK